MGPCLFTNGRPERRSLGRVFGIEPPVLYFQFLQWLYDRCDGDVDAAELLHERMLGLSCRDGVLTLYGQTPRELFAIGRTGIDGEHAGFLVHTPERPTDDYPWAFFAPCGDGLDIIAMDTATFLSQVFSYRLNRGGEEAESIQAACSALGIVASREAGESLLPVGVHSDPPPFDLAVPAGWAFEPTDDKVGVLAPREAFAPEPPLTSLYTSTTTELDQQAMQSLNAGFPADALLYARQSARQCVSDIVNGIMIDSYRALGRDLIADRLVRDPME